MRQKDMEMQVTKKPPRDEGSGRAKPSSSTHKALITRNLRLAYGEVASEPVPRKLMDLLEKLDGSEGEKS
jgi:hypothetical protein